MSNVPLDRLITTVQLRLVGSVIPAIKQELFSVLDEFCQASGAWYDTVQFVAQEDVTDYTIVSPVGQIIRINGVVNSGGTPVNAAFNLPTDLQLSTAPVADDTYSVYVVLSVNDPVDRSSYPIVPHALTTKYTGVLLDGILAHMMSQSAKPYADQNMAAYHLKRFRNGIASARVDALKQNSGQNQAWVFPGGFSTRSQRR